MDTVADQTLYSVKLADTVDESCGRVHDSLEPIKLVLWSAGQQTVAVVDPSDDKAIDYCFCGFRWQSSGRTLCAVELVKAAANKLADMRTERQLCIENHSKVAHRAGWLDRRTAERQWFTAQLMLARCVAHLIKSVFAGFSLSLLEAIH